ncbi:hypothetical protein [Chitinophaga sp. CF418]|nr:hypothetical protein [Chitinophaga sp. CF418]
MQYTLSIHGDDLVLIPGYLWRCHCDNIGCQVLPVAGRTILVHASHL